MGSITVKHVLTIVLSVLIVATVALGAVVYMDVKGASDSAKSTSATPAVGLSASNNSEDSSTQVASDTPVSSVVVASPTVDAEPATATKDPAQKTSATDSAAGAELESGAGNAMPSIPADWWIHGMTLRLLPDNRGRIGVRSGGAGGIWSLRWEQVSDDEIVLAIGEPIELYPESLGESSFFPGALYRAQLSPDRFYLNLVLVEGHGLDSVQLCNGDQPSRESCGA